MKLFQDGAITFGTSVARLAVAAVTGIIIARFLGPEGRGQLALLLLIPSMASALGDLGVGQSSVYMLVNRRVPLSRVVTGVVIVALILGGAAALLSFGLFSGTRGSMFKGVEPLHFYLILSTLPAWLIFKYIMNVYRGIQRPLSYNLTNFLEPLSYLVLVGLLFIYSAGTGQAVMARTLTIFLIAAFAFFLLRLHAPGLRPDFHAATVRGLLGTGSQISIMLAIGFLNRRVGLFLVNGFLGNEEVGYFITALVLAEMIWLIPDSVGVVLFPKIAGSTREEANRITSQTSRYVILMGAAIAVAIAAFGKAAIALLYGDEFAPAYTSLLILLPGVVLFGVHKVIWRDLMGRGAPLLSAYSRIAALFTTVVLSILLIPVMGVAGAALAISLSYVVATAVMLVTFRQVSGVSLSRMLLIQNGDFAVLASQVRLLASQTANRRSRESEV